MSMVPLEAAWYLEVWPPGETLLALLWGCPQQLSPCSPTYLPPPARPQAKEGSGTGTYYQGGRGKYSRVSRKP